MPVLDRDLVRAVNSGRCFALVGAGPSTELGVPSWRDLGQQAMAMLDQAQNPDTVDRARRFLHRRDYPAVFNEVEKQLGSARLMDFVSSSMHSTAKGSLYHRIASWPFATYLTTNFDDHLFRHLSDFGVVASPRLNTMEDMQVLRADSKNLVMKIHGQPSDPTTMVFTSQQYQEFQKSPKRRYWRDKIMSALNMVDLVIIGYSASDPDFTDQLERAKTIAAPDRPIFMFAAEVDPDKAAEYLEQYNVRIIPYRLIDGTHRDLHRLLAAYDPFIARRGSAVLGQEPIDEEEATLASSIYLFTQLRVSNTKDTCLEKACAAVTLKALGDDASQTGLTIDSLLQSLARTTFATSHADPVALEKALNYLHDLGFIAESHDGLRVTLQPAGKTELARLKAERTLLRDKFEGACRIFLKRQYPDIDAKTSNTVITTMAHALVSAFRARGMEIARVAFTEGTFDLSSATDILNTINRSADTLPDLDSRRAFADLMIEVLLRPGEEIRDYLAALSQGYFAFHAMGLDPGCSQQRLNMIRDVAWIIDSNVLISLLATDCPNHAYAKDLLARMRSLGLQCFTTTKLFREVRSHASFAIAAFSKLPADSVQMLELILSPGYRQNLFVDGFIKWSVSNGNPKAHQYMTQCLGERYAEDLSGALKKRVTDMQIGLRDLPDWPGFSADKWGDLPATASDIQQLRRERGTFRSEEQCAAEAEIVLLYQTEKIAFLSQSGLLDDIGRTKRQLTLRPEAMYRFLSLFSSVPTDKDLLYQCMQEDFFFSGFSVVDQQAITQFVTPMLQQARMQLDAEKLEYERVLGTRRYTDLRDTFELVPDEQKPFYSIQFAFYVARQQARKNEAELVATKVRAERAEETKKLTDTERRDYQRLKMKEQERIRNEEKRKLTHDSHSRQKAKLKKKNKKKR